MSDQLSLLPDEEAAHAEAKRLAKKADPATSYAAARWMVDSGELKGQRRKVFEMVKRFPGRTSDELAAETGVPRPVFARRLPELVELGWLKRGPARPSSISKRSAVTWEVGLE